MNTQSRDKRAVLVSDLSSTTTGKRQKKITDFGNVTQQTSSISANLEREEEDSSVKEDLSVSEQCRKWKDHYYYGFDWIEFNRDLGRVFCKSCREGNSKSPYSVTGAINIRHHAFTHHQGTAEHKKLRFAHIHKKSMEQVMKSSKHLADSAVLNLFKTAYHIARVNLPFAKFPGMCAWLTSVGCELTVSLYQSERSCVSMIHCISNAVQQMILERVKKSPFFGLMVDEATDVSVTSALVLFAIFLENGVVKVVFLGLVHVTDKTASGLTENIRLKLTSWGLDSTRLVSFGSDGASVMVGKDSGVATRLKNSVNPYLLNVHCIAHRTNLAVLSATKHPECKDVTNRAYDETWFRFEKGTGKHANNFRLRNYFSDDVLVSRTHQKPQVYNHNPDEVYDDQYFTFLFEDMEIFKVEYHLDLGKIVSSTPKIISQQTLHNYTTAEQTMTFEVDEKVSHTSTFEYTLGFTISVGTTFKAGLPLIAEAGFTVGLENRHDFKWGSTGCTQVSPSKLHQTPPSVPFPASTLVT
ncbi:hypothetical protein R1sor_004407 [Riccia sorocarpa]|uniref:Transposase n=1 Tax=Riccia sorocarpa TaxID=122646 RepID=A0ABD3HIT5_9MARC